MPRIAQGYTTMTFTEETYRQCLAAVAPREVAAARERGLYNPNFNMVIQNKPNTTLRETILDALSGKDLTTSQLQRRTCATMSHTHGTLCKMRDEGLVQSRRVVIDGQAKDKWRLV
jgi:hypothetical protein